MEFTLMFNNSLFWPAVGSLVFSVFLAIYVFKNPPYVNPKDNSINPAIYASVSFVLLLSYIWSARGESILWSLQQHQDLLTTNGQIISSATANKSGKFQAWYYQIHYEYEIDGRRYESNRVNYGTSVSKDSSVAMQYVDKYPIGKDVLVYYDSFDPQESVLEPDVKAYTGFLLIIILCAIEIFFLAYGIARKSA